MSPFGEGMISGEDLLSPWFTHKKDDEIQQVGSGGVLVDKRDESEEAQSNESGDILQQKSSPTKPRRLDSDNQHSLQLIEFREESAHQHIIGNLSGSGTSHQHSAAGNTGNNNNTNSNSNNQNINFNSNNNSNNNSVQLLNQNSGQDITPSDISLRKNSNNTTANQFLSGFLHEKSGRHISLHNKEQSLLLSQHASQTLSKVSSNNMSPSSSSHHEIAQLSNHLQGSTHTFNMDRDDINRKSRISSQNQQNSANFDIRKGVSIGDNQNNLNTLSNNINNNNTITFQGLKANSLRQGEHQQSGTGFKSFANFLALGRIKKKLLNTISSWKFKKINVFHLKLINDPAALELPVFQRQQLSKKQINWRNSQKNISSNTYSNNVSNISQASKQNISKTVDLSNSLTNQKLFFQSMQEEKLQESTVDLVKEQVDSEDEYRPNNQVFWPDNTYLILWDCILMFLLIFLCVITPIKRCFNTDFQDSNGLEAVEIYLSTIWLAADIALTFNKGYYDEGMVISNRKKILKRYMKFYLWLDLFNLVCSVFSNHTPIVLVLVVSVYRLIRASKLWSEIDEYFEFSHRSPTTAQILELAFLIFLIAHLCACVFFYISEYDYKRGVELTWIQFQKIENSYWRKQYVYSIYFEFITMTTIGYGDIYPCSDNERIVVIFMTLVSCGVFGYSLNAIGQIFRDLSMQLSSFKQTKYDISKYLKSRNITKRIQFQIFKYLEYLNRQENEGHFFMKGEKILNRVSQNLREEVQREYYGKIINQINFFTKNFSKGFLNDLSLYMKELNLAPGEYLFKEGNTDSSLFFLNKGLVEVCILIPQKNDKNKEKVITKYSGGSLIGHQEFLSEQQRSFSARSINISHFVYVRKPDLFHLFEKFPLDYENFCTLKDDLMLKGQDRFSFCESCQTYGHCIIKCELLFPKRDRQLLTKRLNYTEDQPRRMHSRHYMFKRRFEVNQVKVNLKQFRKDFIARAIRKNKKQLQQQQQQQQQRQQSLSHQPSNNLQDDSGVVLSDFSDTNNNTPNNNNFNYNNVPSRDESNQRYTGSFAGAPDRDTMSFKSFSRRGNTSTDLINDDDRMFYKKYPKISYEDDNYLILSSSQTSSSGEDYTDDEEEDNFQMPMQYAQPVYSSSQIPGYDNHSKAQQMQQYMNQIDLSDRFRANIKNATISSTSPQLFQSSGPQQPQPQFSQQQQQGFTSPNSKSQSQTTIQMEGSLQIPNQVPNFTLENNVNPTFLVNRHMSSNQSSSSSTLNTLPFSQLSATQYQQQASIGPQSPNTQAIQQQREREQAIQQNQIIGSGSNLSNSPIMQLPQLPPQIPLANINQLILALNNTSNAINNSNQYNQGNNQNSQQKNYFDFQDFSSEQDPNHPEPRKLTLLLPTVEEASELNEQSVEMLSSFSNQLSMSPLLRKKNREQSRRHQSRKFSSNSLSRTDSLQSIKDDLFSRRKGSRNDTRHDSRLEARIEMQRQGERHDTLNTNNKAYKDPKKVTYMDPQLLRDSVISASNHPSSQQSINMQNTLSKSHSRSSKALQYGFDRQRSRSQVTYLNPQQNLFIYSFDICQEFKYYYPHNNMSLVLKSISKPLKKKRPTKTRKHNGTLLSGANLLRSANQFRQQQTHLASSQHMPAVPSPFQPPAQSAG